MSNSTKDLLDDIIIERDETFGDELLSGTLGAVRAQRRQRRTTHTSLAVVALLVLVVCWLNTSSVPQATSITPTVQLTVPANSLHVSTRALAPTEIVATVSGMVESVRSISALDLVVNTESGHRLYQLIDDAELRSMLAHRNPVILRQPHRAPRLLLEGEFVGPTIQLN